MSLLRYHLDEDCQSAALAAALRQHGIEVVTTNEAGITGVDDDAQLEHAAKQGTTMVTNNICDYAPAAHPLARGRPASRGHRPFPAARTLGRRSRPAIGASAPHASR